MRAVIQRVSEAAVRIDGEIKAAIPNGLVVLLAVEEADTAEDIEWLSGKFVSLRIFNAPAPVHRHSRYFFSGKRRFASRVLSARSAGSQS